MTVRHYFVQKILQGVALSSGLRNDIDVLVVVEDGLRIGVCMFKSL